MVLQTVTEILQQLLASLAQVNSSTPLHTTCPATRKFDHQFFPNYYPEFASSRNYVFINEPDQLAKLIPHLTPGETISGSDPDLTSKFGGNRN
jgi:hypothetical protein